jgi:hypothetical protein
MNCSFHNDKLIPTSELSHKKNQIIQETAMEFLDPILFDLKKKNRMETVQKKSTNQLSS